MHFLKACLGPCSLLGAFTNSSCQAALPQVLGIPRNADSVTLQRAYKKKLSDAKGNEAAVQRIEAAHSNIMMSSLTSRLQVTLNTGQCWRYYQHRPRVDGHEDLVGPLALRWQSAAVWALLGSPWALEVKVVEQCNPQCNPLK